MIKIFSFMGLLATLLSGPAQPMPADAAMDKSAVRRPPGNRPDEATRFHSLAMELAAVR